MRRMKSRSKLAFGNRCKQISGNLMIDRLRNRQTFSTHFRCNARKAFGYVDEQILHGRDFRLFSADPCDGASRIACGFLTADNRTFSLSYMYFLHRLPGPASERADKRRRAFKRRGKRAVCLLLCSFLLYSNADDKYVVKTTSTNF